MGKNKTKKGVDRVLEEIKYTRKPSLNIKRTVFVRFSIRSVLIFSTKKLKIHSYDYENYRCCQQIFELNRVNYLDLVIDSNLRLELKLCV